VGTGAADFGRLVCAFHLESLLWTPTTIRETRDYRKLSQLRQGLGWDCGSNLATRASKSGMWITL
jgi:hypothetical protein